MKKNNLMVALLVATILPVTVTHAQLLIGAQTTTRATATATASAKSTISVESISPAIRKVKFANPPVNLIVPETVTALNETIKELSSDEHVKVVIFSSDVRGYFFNHFDTNQFPGFLSQIGENEKPLWVELITNISHAPFITIATIRGRTRGGGDELIMAFDLRYASKEKAIFGQPEIGIGLFPGGGGTDHLTRMIGRDRALEVFLSSDDYDAEQAEEYGWVTRTLSDKQLDFFIEKMAHRLATFDKTALVTLKQKVNAISLPSEADLLNSYSEFTQSLAWPGLQQRLPVFERMTRDLGIERIESNLGYYIGVGNKQLQ